MRPRSSKLIDSGWVTSGSATTRLISSPSATVNCLSDSAGESGPGWSGAGSPSARCIAPATNAAASKEAQPNSLAGPEAAFSRCYASYSPAWRIVLAWGGRWDFEGAWQPAGCLS